MCHVYEKSVNVSMCCKILMLSMSSGGFKSMSCCIIISFLPLPLPSQIKLGRRKWRDNSHTCGSYITLLQNKEERKTRSREIKRDEGATMLLREVCVEIGVDTFDRRHQKTGGGNGNPYEKTPDVLCVNINSDRRKDDGKLPEERRQQSDKSRAVEICTLSLMDTEKS